MNLEALIFLGAKAPLGPLQFVKVKLKVKVKQKSFKIEGCCRLCKNTAYIVRNSNKLYAKGQGGCKFVSWVFKGWFKGVSWVFQGCFEGISRLFNHFFRVF